MNAVESCYYKDEDKSMNSNETLNAVFMILNKILDYTKDLDENTPSVFDHYHHHSHENDKSSLSTSYSDTSSSGPDFCCELDKYDMEDFIYRCYKMLGFDSNLMILSMMNLDKLLANKFILNSTNVHKAFFTCMMETQKYYDDESFTNKVYAKTCGISTEELLELELEFMNYIDFNIYIKDEDFFEYKKKIQSLYESSVIISNTYIQNEEDED